MGISSVLGVIKMIVGRKSRRQIVFEYTYNIIRDGDKHLKGKLAMMVFDRIRGSKLPNSLKLLPIEWLGDVRRVCGVTPSKEPDEQEIAHATQLLKDFLSPNIFTTDDIKFLLSSVVHGRGPPSFDYIGIDKTNNKKVLLDVKSTHSRSGIQLTFSPNEREVMARAKGLSFDIYAALIIYLLNWSVEIKLIKL
jgi:hypothetical protein